MAPNLDFYWWCIQHFCWKSAFCLWLLVVQNLLLYFKFKNYWWCSCTWCLAGLAPLGIYLEYWYIYLTTQWFRDEWPITMWQGRVGWLWLSEIMWHLLCHNNNNWQCQPLGASRPRVQPNPSKTRWALVKNTSGIASTPIKRSHLWTSTTSLV